MANALLSLCLDTSRLMKRHPEVGMENTGGSCCRTNKPVLLKSLWFIIDIVNFVKHEKKTSVWKLLTNEYFFKGGSTG